jgi:hypothetical protein
MGSRRIQLIVASVGLLILLGVTLFVSSRPTETDLKVHEDARGQLPIVDPDEVHELEIRAPDRPPVRLTLNEGDWRMEAPIDAQANANYVTLALRKLGELPELHRGVAATKSTSHERLEVTEDKAVEVVARHDDGVVAHVFIGAFKGGATMVRVAGEDTVHSLKGSFKANFNRSVTDWRERKIVDEAAADVRGIRLVGEHGAFHFVREGSDQPWHPAEGHDAPDGFDPDTVQSLVSSLARMRAASFAEPSMNRDAAGIGPDSNTVTLDLEAGEVVLRLGNALGDGSQFYLTREGREPIYVVSKFIAERFTPKPEQFIKGAPQPGADLPEGVTKEQLDDLIQQLQKSPIKMK